MEKFKREISNKEHWKGLVKRYFQMETLLRAFFRIDFSKEQVLKRIKMDQFIRAILRIH
jgi:hypothetical protein